MYPWSLNPNFTLYFYPYLAVYLLLSYSFFEFIKLHVSRKLTKREYLYSRRILSRTLCRKKKRNFKIKIGGRTRSGRRELYVINKKRKSRRVRQYLAIIEADRLLRPVVVVSQIPRQTFEREMMRCPRVHPYILRSSSSCFRMRCNIARRFTPICRVFRII